MKARYLKIIFNYLVFAIGAMLLVHFWKVFGVATTTDNTLAIIGFILMIIAATVESYNYRFRKGEDDERAGNRNP